MKKLFILLGLLIFNILCVSCDKREIEYDYSYSKLNIKLNEKILNTSFKEDYEKMSLKKLEKTYQKDAVKEIFINADMATNDYYTCGYINQKAIKVLDKIDISEENKYFEEFSGRKDYIRKYNIATQEKKINRSKYPIIWFEIPKGQEVPNEIGDLTLVMVLQNKNIKYQSICEDIIEEDTDIKEVIFFVEDRSFYDELSKENSDEIDMADEYLVFISNEELMEDEILIPYELNMIKNCQGFRIECESGKDRYINTNYEYEFNEFDLRDIVRYTIKEEKEFLFNVDEFIKCLKQNYKNEMIGTTEKKYSISKNNSLLNELSKKVDHLSSSSVIIPNLNLENFDERYEHETYSGLIIKHTSLIDDYYTCGYVSNEIKDTLNSIMFYGGDKWIGRNYYISKYNLALSIGRISSEEYPISWYEIPKTEKIPREIEGKFLVIISESRDVIITDIDMNEKEVIKVYFENKKIYENELSENDSRYDFIISNREYLIFKDKEIGWNFETILETDSLINPTSSGLEIKYYNGLPYLNIGVVPIYNEVDLRESYDYKEEKKGKTYYYFQLKDIINILLGGKNE